MSRMIDADAVARALVEHGHVKETDMAGCRIGEFASIYGIPV